MCSFRVPLYRVKGNHYECSHAVGTLAREAILHRIANDLNVLSSLFSFVQTGYGQELHQNFIKRIREFYPWYWDEIRGIADGSQIPLEQILVLNFLNETRTAYRLFEEQKTIDEKNQQLTNETGEKGCSTVLLNRKDANILSLLHNEDHSIALLTTAYLVEAEIQSSKYDDGKRESPSEKFIAYCYAGAIPGNAFGVNKHGFVCALNGLYPNFVAHGRLPRQILNRALLSIQNENELDQMVNSSPVAFGFCINGGFIHQSKYLLNYEIGPNISVNDQNYVSKCFITTKEDIPQHKNEDVVAINYLVHYNHYERLDHVINQQKLLQSSYSRWERGQEIGEIFSIQDALNLLGDHENELFPIFRAPDTIKFGTATLCTVHINFLTLELIIYQDNPKENNQETFVYNLTELLV